MFNTNFYAPLLMTRGFAPELAKARGAVVNLTSIAGVARASVRRRRVRDVEGGARAR